MKSQPNIIRSIPRRLSRRTMLRGAFGAGVSLPFLDAMMPRSSHAQVVIPKRFGVFFSACGTTPEFWTPVGTTPGVTATPSKTNPAVHTNFTLSPILQPLAPHQQNIVVLRGVSMESTQSKYGPIANVHDQGMTHMLTAIPLIQGPGGAGRANHFVDGGAGGPSIDQHIAKAIGGTTLLRSLELGVNSKDTFLELLVTQMCYGDVNQMDTNPRGKRATVVPPVDDPVQIFTRLFGTNQQGTPAQVIATLKNRQSVLDYARADYTTLMSKVGADDRSKLQMHLDQVRSIEDQLTRLISTPQMCPGSATIMPVSPARQACLRDQTLRTAAQMAADRAAQAAGLLPANNCVTNYPLIGKLQLDLMVLAYSCDLTRVASMQWSTAESTVVHSWLPTPPFPYLSTLPAVQYAGTQEHHMLTHNETVAVSALNMTYNPDNPALMTLNQATVNTVRGDLSHINTWYAMQYAYLLSQLKGIQQPNGTTLLDNTLMLWTSELGVGGVHSYTNIPYVLAGGPGVGITGGRFVDFLGPTAYPPGQNAIPFGVGPAHNRMFVSLMQKMGVAGTTFGMTGAATGEQALFSGPLPGI
jgi:Protein of unknown function (DUF1552)